MPLRLDPESPRRALGVRVDANDVGRRVTLRALVPGPDGGRVASDTVGHLLSWDGVTAVVRRRDGTVRAVPIGDVVAGRVVAEHPGRFPADVAVLRSVIARAWPAVETRRLGGWWLRASGGRDAGSDAAVALGGPGVGLDEALAEVASFYAARGTPAQVLTVPGVRLDAALAARGWRPAGPATAVLVRTPDVAAAPAVGAAGETPGIGAATASPDAQTVGREAGEEAAAAEAPDARNVVREAGEIAAAAAEVDVSGDHGAGPRRDPAGRGWTTALAAEPDADWLRAASPLGVHPGASVLLSGPFPIAFATVRDAGGEVVTVARGAVVDGWLHVGAVRVLDARPSGPGAGTPTAAVAEAGNAEAGAGADGPLEATRAGMDRHERERLGVAALLDVLVPWAARHGAESVVTEVAGRPGTPPAQENSAPVSGKLGTGAVASAGSATGDNSAVVGPWAGFTVHHTWLVRRPPADVA